MGIECLYPEERNATVKPTPPTASRLELLQGTLDLIVLQALRWGPQHGYALSQRVRLASGDRLQVDAGSLYPALHRLKRQKLVASEWATAVSGQRVKVYTLTTAGRVRLEDARSRWQEFAETMEWLLRDPTPQE